MGAIGKAGRTAKRLRAMMLLSTAAVLLTTAAPPVRAQDTPPPERPAPAPPAAFAYGVSWYPEHFPESGWDAELALMRKARIRYVRIAEFAWAKMEPREGVYDFAWLDRAIARAQAHGLKVMIGTPTAAPPIWLTQAYPDTLVVEADGRPARHGGRRQFSVGSARYRTFAARIAGELARRYGRHPAVIGFQIDNEYGRATYDGETRKRFQDWMQRRYATVDAMNQRHFNVYWSLIYSDWAQINIPDANDQPQLWIDWLRFFSDAWADYQRVQIDAMRPHLAPGVAITTNYVAHYDNFDFGVPAQQLDFVGWDWYFEGARLVPGEGALLHDLYRGYLGRAPWILEAAPGNMNWSDRNYTQPRGELRAMVWQSVAHGADGYSFWALRMPLNGRETNHGALLDAGGRPNPVYDEIARTGVELEKAWPAVKGTVPQTDVALLYDYPSRWAIERQPMTADYDVWKHFARYRGALMRAAKGVDVPRNWDGLSRYPMVVAPSLHLMSPKTAQRLAAYVEGGGHLVLGPRSGVKDEDSNLWQPGQLGPLETMLGARIDMSAIPPAPWPVSGSVGGGSATVWAERLTPQAADVEVLLRYGTADGWLDGQAAVVTRPVGKGRITYVGAWLDEETLGRVIAWAAARAKVSPVWPDIPADVEVTARQSGDRTVYVAINWGTVPQTVRLPQPMKMLLGDGGMTAEARLAPWDVAVFEAPR